MCSEKIVLLNDLRKEICGRYGSFMRIGIKKIASFAL